MLRFFWSILLCLLPLIALCQQPATMPDKSWMQMNMDSLYRKVTGSTYMPFDVTTLEGSRLTNVSCKGKVTIINFWFEGCGPCRGEFGELNSLYDSIIKMPSVQMVAVTFDAKETLPPFIAKHQLRYPIATVESQRESKRLDYNMGYPNTIILDKQGKVAYIGMKAIGEVNEEYKVSMSKLLNIIKDCANRN